MNIFIRELKANRKALIIWSICMFLFVISGMAKYTAYSTGANNEVFNKMPFTLKALLGFQNFDVTRIGGFYALLFPYIEVAAAIHAVLLGSGIIAKEERDKTAEFLAVKPVSRSVIITSKLSAALINVVIVNIASLISSIMIVASFNKGYDITDEIVMFHLSMFIIQLIFLSLGSFVSSLIKNPKSSGSAASAILFGTVVISKITDLTDRVNAINVLSPFKYFNSEDIVNGNGLKGAAVILSILLSMAFILLAYYYYNKRDMNV